ncbi:hypothetical protein RCCGE510_12606 [Rhizobium sp. CCGE 510]|nr:hypothetical protein RCCGE510_12606 [Rhizobium sp. CCGE 510]
MPFGKLANMAFPITIYGLTNCQAMRAAGISLVKIGVLPCLKLPFTLAHRQSCRCHVADDSGADCLAIALSIKKVRVDERLVSQGGDPQS